jgi:N-formylglutamate deformylase
VVDLNRPSDGSALYPGLRETSVCPTTTFSGQPLYAEGLAPDQQEIAARISTYWKPYHAMLETTLAALRVRFGYALLWDAHSIRSEVPMLFEGRLPDFNVGIGAGACPQDVAEKLLAVAESGAHHGAVLNGRFKGGFITRRYGAPDSNVWAVQLELSQKTYMDEDRPALGLTNEAEATQTTIREMLATYIELGRKTLRK